MGWTIQKINTGTGEVTMRNDDGETLDLTIPHEHRHDPYTGLAYLNQVCAIHESMPTENLGSQPNHPSHALFFAALFVASLGLLALIVWRLA